MTQFKASKSSIPAVHADAMPLTALVLAIVLVGASGCANSDFAGSSRQAAAERGGTGKDSGDNDEDLYGRDGDSDGDSDGDGDSDSDGDGDGDGVSDGDGGLDADDDLAFKSDDPTIQTEEGSLRVKKCSREYAVPGSANPWLAGVPNGTEIRYDKTTDRAPGQSPILVDPKIGKCLEPGAKIYFTVKGKISHGTSAPTDADGKPDGIVDHENGATNGLSNIRAPLNSLLGVFVGSGGTPGTLDFSSPAKRNYKTLKPKVGQVFFIGTGKSDDGTAQKIVVPEGAKKLYMAIMDGFEWNNNTGNLTGSILWDPEG